MSTETPYVTIVTSTGKPLAVTAEDAQEMAEDLLRFTSALERIAAGPYNGFEQCKAIAREALDVDD